MNKPLVSSRFREKRLPIGAEGTPVGASWERSPGPRERRGSAAYGPGAEPRSPSAGRASSQAGAPAARSEGLQTTSG